MELNNKKVYYILIILILISLYFFINIFGSGWFKHPDEYASYFAVYNLLDHGKISMQDNLINFIPDGYYKIGDSFSSPKPALEFYLLSIFIILSPKLFFWISSFLSSFCLFLLFLIIRKKGKLDKIALLITFLFGSSFLFIYWANFPYYNLVVSVFFIFGVYLFFNHPNLSKVISSILFSFSILLRYEFLLFFLMTFVLIFIFNKNRREEILFVVLLVGILTAPVLIFNHINYGNYFDTPYFSNDAAISNSLEGNFIDRIYNRFFAGDFHPDIKRIFNNFNDWVLNIYPWLVIFLIPSIFYFLRNKKRQIFQLFLIIPSVYWAFNVLRGYHWGEGSNFIGTAYIRYLSFTFISFFIFVSPYLKNFVKKNRLIACFLLFFIIAQSMIFCFGSPPDDLASNLIKNNFYSEVNSNLLEENSSIILTSFYGKYLTKKEVLNLRPPTFYDGEDYASEILNSKKQLIMTYDKIIIFDDPKRENMTLLYDFIEKINYTKIHEEEFAYEDQDLKWIIFQSP